MSSLQSVQAPAKAAPATQVQSASGAIAPTPTTYPTQPRPATVPPAILPAPLQVVVQNVTASVNLHIPIDITSVVSKVKNAEYNAKKLPACVMRIREPQATGLLFGSGKLMVTGAKGVQAARDAAQKFVAVIASLQLKPSFMNFTVHNIVVSAELSYNVDLESLGYVQARSCMYEPELFPGVIFQTRRKGVIAHVFRTGKVVVTGARNEDILNDALNQLLPILVQYREGAPMGP